VILAGELLFAILVSGLVIMTALPIILRPQLIVLSEKK